MVLSQAIRCCWVRRARSRQVRRSSSLLARTEARRTMFISDFSIKRPLVTVVLMMIIAGAGLFALANLKTDEYPEVSPPVIAVSLIYPGASPQGVERDVVDPIEEAFAGISGVDEIRSFSQDGYGQVIVMFDFEKDLKEASQDIRDQISTIRGDLPSELEEPILSRF